MRRRRRRRRRRIAEDEEGRERWTTKGGMDEAKVARAEGGGGGAPLNGAKRGPRHPGASAGARKHGDRVSCFLIYGRQQWTPKKQKTKDGLFISLHFRFTIRATQASKFLSILHEAPSSVRIRTQNLRYSSLLPPKEENVTAETVGGERPIFQQENSDSNFMQMAAPGGVLERSGAEGRRRCTEGCAARVGREGGPRRSVTRSYTGMGREGRKKSDKTMERNLNYAPRKMAIVCKAMLIRRRRKRGAADLSQMPPGRTAFPFGSISFAAPTVGPPLGPPPPTLRRKDFVPLAWKPESSFLDPKASNQQGHASDVIEKNAISRVSPNSPKSLPSASSASTRGLPQDSHEAFRVYPGQLAAGNDGAPESPLFRFRPLSTDAGGKKWS
ncbi:hypothetical protein KM043_011645 [Ampulex compressa]|nr:hypothetical protein KM043_011645 [Ampulex compressa]